VPLHLYGVVPVTGSEPQVGHGRQDRPVRLVQGSGLRAVVSEIAEDAPVRRDDLLAHAHVLEALAAAVPVVPVQFGTIVPDEDAVVRDVLEPQHADLLALLDAFADVVQLTVEVSHREEAALRELLLRDPDLAALRDHVRAHPAAQQEKMRLGEAVVAGLEALRADDAAVVVDRVAPHVHAVAENEPRGTQGVANLALLVDREEHTALDEAVTLLGEELGPRAQVRYVGPQPPWSFLDPVANGDLAWA
jgi:hypothetical protein